MCCHMKPTRSTLILAWVLVKELIYFFAAFYQLYLNFIAQQCSLNSGTGNDEMYARTWRVRWNTNFYTNFSCMILWISRVDFLFCPPDLIPPFPNRHGFPACINCFACHAIFLLLLERLYLHIPFQLPARLVSLLE